eukprot:3363405-Amphidinium_carterae.2
MTLEHPNPLMTLGLEKVRSSVCTSFLVRADCEPFSPNPNGHGNGKRRRSGAKQKDSSCEQHINKALYSA